MQYICMHARVTCSQLARMSVLMCLCSSLSFCPPVCPRGTSDIVRAGASV